MTPIALKNFFGKSGWDFEWKRNDGEVIAFDCHSCFYVDVFTKYQVAELTPIFCEADDQIYGNVPNIGWARTKTIGKGYEVCDFKIVNAKVK